MASPSDETDMFRMDVTWKDENEVIVKLLTLDTAIINPEGGSSEDLVPNEERTRHEGDFRKSYVNKRRKMNLCVKKITFHVEKRPSGSSSRESSGESLQPSTSSSGEGVKTEDQNGNGILKETEQAALPFQREMITIETEVKMVTSSQKGKVKRVPVPIQTTVKKAAELVNAPPIQNLGEKIGTEVEKNASLTKMEVKNNTTKQAVVKTVGSPIQPVVKKVASHTQAEMTKVDFSMQTKGKRVYSPMEKVVKKLPLIVLRNVRKAVSPMQTEVKKVDSQIETGKDKVALPVSVASKPVVEPMVTKTKQGGLSVPRKAVKMLSTSNERNPDIIQPHAIALYKNRMSSSTAPPTLVKKPVTLPSGKVVYLTPVAKEIVMRKNAVVHVLPDTVVMEPDMKSPQKTVAKEVVMRAKTEEKVLPDGHPKSPSKLPIYLRKTAEPARPVKPVTQARPEISYTGIYSSNAEPISPFKKNQNLIIGYPPLSPTSCQPKILRSESKPPKAFLLPRPRTAETSYECPACNKIFTKKKHLSVHLKTHSGERKAANKPCLECGKLFVDNTQLRIHSRVHSGAKPFTCELCDKKFKHQTSLSRHFLYHTQERPCACDVCPKTYRNNSDLMNHKRSHTNERPFSCKFCEKRFNDRCAKNTHERIHSDKKYKCNLCLQSFAQSTTLKGHMITHSEERPFSCSLCEMKFKSKVVLRSHERVHTAGKTFQCEFCELLFTEKRTLTRHLYTHKEKPFPCSFCKRWYFREDRYRAHLEKHNTKERPFKCEFCHKRYTNEGYLKLHSLKAHNPLEGCEGQFQCKFKSCDKTFPRLISLTRHMKTHGNIYVLECDICKKRFAKKHTLQMHLIKVHKFASSFTCSKCDKTFIRKSHLTRHIFVKCS